MGKKHKNIVTSDLGKVLKNSFGGSLIDFFKWVWAGSNMIGGLSLSI